MSKYDDYYLDPEVAEAYDVSSPGLEGDVDFYLALAKEAAAGGGQALELACGTGRVAVPIARAGVQITGLDRSPAMLALARRKNEGLPNLKLVDGDMAQFDLGESFGLVLIPYRSFLHLMTVGEQKSCLRCVLDHLAPGGRLALNFFNPDIVLMAAWMGPARKGLQPVGELPSAREGRVVEWETRRYLTATQHIDEDRIEERLSHQGAVISRVFRKMGLRYVFRYEMQHLLELTGFEVEALYGGFRGEPFTDASTEMVWVARKAAI